MRLPELTENFDSTTLLPCLIHFVRDVIDRDPALSLLFKMAIISRFTQHLTQQRRPHATNPLRSLRAPDVCHLLIRQQTW